MVDRAFFQELAPLDWIGLGTVVVLLVMGLVRGLWWQVIRLLGVLVALLLARLFAADGAAWLREVWPELAPRLAQGIAWVGIFALALGAASILGHLGQRLLEAMQLGAANRLAGGLAGALTGFFVHLAVLLTIALTASEGFVRSHVAGTYSQRVYRALGNRWQVVLGAEAAEELDRLLEPVLEPDPATGPGTLDGPPPLDSPTDVR